MLAGNLVFVLHYGRAKGREIICAMSLFMVDTQSIIQRVTPTYGAGWVAAPWVNTINGFQTIQPNPHFNSRGQIVYLLERVDREPVEIVPADEVMQEESL